MQIIKKLYRKSRGRLFVHLCVSYESNENLAPEIAHEIGSKIALYWSEFQVIMGTHLDAAHLHNHYLINTVNVDTGNKFQQSPDDMKKFKKYVNVIFESYHLDPVTEIYKTEFYEDVFDEDFNIDEWDIICEIVDDDMLFELMDYPDNEAWEMMSENDQVAFADRWGFFFPYLNEGEYEKYQEHLRYSSMSEDELIEYAEKESKLQLFTDEYEVERYQDYLRASNMSEDEAIAYTEDLYKKMELEGAFDEQLEQREAIDMEQMILELEEQKSFFYKKRT